jgi:hypothetical protein
MSFMAYILICVATLAVVGLFACAVHWVLNYWGGPIRRAAEVERSDVVSKGVVYIGPADVEPATFKELAHAMTKLPKSPDEEPLILNIEASEVIETPAKKSYRDGLGRAVVGP